MRKLTKTGHYDSHRSFENVRTLYHFGSTAVIPELFSSSETEPKLCAALR